ncbi:MAG: hypothetical protein FJX45_13640 [Alphaproteobacteria bacterium]|nr:hypothetical protein [Alphaproteobacteria bacterium]
MTRAAPLQLQTRAAELVPASFEPSDNSVDVIFTTGATVRRNSWNDGPYDEELVVSENSVRLDRLNAGGPFLDTHDQFSLRAVIGSVVPGGARIEGGKGFARIKMSSAPGDADTVLKIREGVIRNVSVGYISHRIEKQERDGQVPLWRVTDWEPYEISAVPAPADAGCQIRGASADDDTERAAPGAMTARETLDLLQRAEFYGERELAERMIGEGGDEAAIIAAVQAARARSAPPPIGGPRAEIGNERATNMRSHHNDHISLDNPANREEALIAAAVCAARGLEPKGAAREFSHLRSWEDFNHAYVGADRRGTQWGERGGLHTGSDFPILTATGRVIVDDGYRTNLSPMLSLARTIDVPDFKGDKIARVSGTGKFLKVEEGGEIKGTSRVEEGESIVPHSFAQQIGYSRQVLINSGMRLAGESFFVLGKAGANALNEGMANTLKENSGNGATLSDGNATFTTSRGNKAASGGAIDITSLSAARLALRQRKEPDNVTPIKLTPWGLLVGPAYETIGLQYTSSAFVPNQASAVNPFGGKLEVLVDQYITGNAWYLFANPSEAAMFTIAYLNGRRTPIVEERQGWDVLGTEYRGIFDFGVAITDWRPGYYNPGAA